MELNILAFSGAEGSSGRVCASEIDVERMASKKGQI
jgi:hypothetical protein